MKRYKSRGRVPGVQQIPSPPATCSGNFYTVKAGDTLATIAYRFGVSVTQIMAANPQIRDPRLIYSGQVICIPAKSPLCPNGTLYTVKAGDTLYLIATRYGITVNDILAVNPQITNPNVLFIGQNICIPPAVSPPTPTPPAPTPPTPTPPTEPELVVPCSIVMEREADVDEVVEGAVLITSNVEAGYNVTFIGLNLPIPEDPDAFLTYIGSVVRAGENPISVELGICTFEPDTWAGTVVVDDLLEGDVFVIRAFTPGEDGPDVLGPILLTAPVNECFI